MIKNYRSSEWLQCDLYIVFPNVYQLVLFFILDECNPMSKKYHMLEGPPLVGRTLSLCVVLVLPVLLLHTQGQRALGCWAGPLET